MSIIPFPEVRAKPERLALRRSVPMTSRFGAALQLAQRQTAALAYCAACAAPIDFGGVLRGEDAYCSVECSTGGHRTA